jgi:3-dehydroquinate dehydratase-2
MKLLIINGPNLNLLGRREPEVYGSQTFEDFFSQLQFKFRSVELGYDQSNIEGELVNSLHTAEEQGFEGIIINAGAYTHTSIAIADAVAGIQIPVVEVHISNVMDRESYRHTSYISRYCKGVISGFGLQGYELAIQSFLSEKSTD